MISVSCWLRLGTFVANRTVAMHMEYDILMCSGQIAKLEMRGYKYMFIVGTPTFQSTGRLLLDVLQVPSHYYHKIFIGSSWLPNFHASTVECHLSDDFGTGPMLDN